MQNLKYLLFGTIFGLILYKAEVISWFRIQEMFHFQSFHMYGVIGGAVVTGMISVVIIKKKNIKTIDGEEIKIEHKKYTKGVLIGGVMFGIGWAFTGACPGPLYALVGAGYWSIGIALLSAILGVYLYGIVKNKLPH
ncbi:MAG: YeeE/YedE thiosulfate transporter family protein [Bacteroidetes bacterium]|nr:YeeE/YedE thiosulfate transporter family protein [Bacteroidota bacterium]